MAVGETIGAFSTITLAYFWIYYKMIIKKKINSEEGKGGGMKEKILHLVYFFLIIGLQVTANIKTFNTVCPNNLGKMAPSIVGWTLIANVVTFGLVILGLLMVKQFSYPFEYTFGNIGCSRMFKQLIDKLRESDSTKYLNRWRTCIDISSDDPDLYKEDVGYDDVYKILCKIVMVRKTISAFIWYILVGIYAITKSNYYTVSQVCPGPATPEVPTPSEGDV